MIKHNYEVTINGIGLRPLVIHLEAHNPGYAERLAKDRYGDWIRISSVRSLDLQQPPLKPSTAQKRTEHRRRLMVTETPTFPAWKSSLADEEAKAAIRRQTIADAMDAQRKADAKKLRKENEMAWR